MSLWQSFADRLQLPVFEVCRTHRQMVPCHATGRRSAIRHYHQSLHCGVKYLRSFFAVLKLIGTAIWKASFSDAFRSCSLRGQWVSPEINAQQQYRVLGSLIYHESLEGVRSVLTSEVCHSVADILVIPETQLFFENQSAHFFPKKNLLCQIPYLSHFACATGSNIAEARTSSILSVCLHSAQ